MKYQILQKLTLILVSIILMSSSVMAADWVKDANLCPTTYQSLTCPSGVHCGYDGSAHCEDPSTINTAMPSSLVTANSANSGLGKGFVLDCVKSGSTCLPWKCETDSTCAGENRKTECTGTTTTNCDVCYDTHLDCATGDSTCEIVKHSTAYPGIANARYAETCGTWECNGNSEDCDNDLSSGTGGNGCEIVNGELCTLYSNGASGTCSLTCGSTGFDGDGNNCSCTQAAAKIFKTGILADYTTSQPLLRGRQDGTGDLMSLATLTSSIGINNDACIVFNDSTVQCTAGGSGLAGLWTNSSGAATYLGNVGIGTVDPDTELEVSSSGVTQLKVTETGDNIELVMRSDSGNDEARIFTNTNHSLSIFSKGNGGTSSQIFLEQATGNVGIGNNNPGEKLDVTGNINATGTICDGFGNCMGDIGQIDPHDDDWVVNGGTGDMYTDPSVTGNIGIGTNSPNAKLDVEVSSGGAATIGAATNSATGKNAVAIGAENNASGETSFVTGKQSEASGQWSTAIGYYAKAKSQGSIAIGEDVSSTGLYSIAIGSSIVVSGQNSVGIGLQGTPGNLSQDNSMAIIGGNVGIGTLSPDRMLTLGDTNYPGQIAFRRQTGGSYGHVGFNLDSGSGDDAYLFEMRSNTGSGEIRINQQSTTDAKGITLWTAGTQQMVVDGAGNVGIGTEHPDSLLDVSSSDDTRVTIKDTEDNSTLILRSDGGDTRIFTETEHDLSIFTRGNGGTVSQLFLDQGTGNVGIGTNNPTEKLKLYGGSGDKVAVQLSNAEGSAELSTNNNDLFLDAAADGIDLTILDDGNVGIGTTAPGARLEVIGELEGFGIKSVIDTNYSDIKSAAGLFEDTAGETKVYLGYVDDNWNAFAGHFTGDVDVTGSLTSTSVSSTSATILGNLRLLGLSGGCLTIENGLVSSASGCGVGTNASITGAGTQGYVPRWDGATSLGNSVIYDTGTNVGIGTSNPGSYKLYVNGDARVSSGLSVGGAIGAGSAVITNALSAGSASIFNTLSAGNVNVNYDLSANTANITDNVTVGTDLTVGGVLTAGGCPVGYADRGSYCIATNLRFSSGASHVDDPQVWDTTIFAKGLQAEAEKYCMIGSPGFATGSRLCTMQEWTTSCEAGVLDMDLRDMSGGEYIARSEHVAFMGGADYCSVEYNSNSGGCFNYQCGSTLGSSNLVYRCCYDKLQ